MTLHNTICCSFVTWETFHTAKFYCLEGVDESFNHYFRSDVRRGRMYTFGLAGNQIDHLPRMTIKKNTCSLNCLKSLIGTSFLAKKTSHDGVFKSNLNVNLAN